MHMKRSAHFATHGRGVKFRLRGRESRLKKGTCVGWYVHLRTSRYMAYSQCCHWWSPGRSSIQ